MSQPPRHNYWTVAGRTCVFLLASTSLACLLADLYGICSMRLFAGYVFFPASCGLIALALFDRRRGDGRLYRWVCVGLVGGLVAAVAYDAFRLPFVFATQWGIDAVFPPMQLFKVFPRFGAMILGEPIEQAHYSWAAQILGWAYHFSNGASLGVMFLALVGKSVRRHWPWAVLFALGLEAGMLLSPYPAVFKIALTPSFVLVTAAAHAIFGLSLGWSIDACIHCLH